MMDKKRILITGSRGQLGSEIKLLAADYPHFNLLFTDVAELDICNPRAVEEFVEKHQVEYIINCAAYTAVDKAESEIELCTQLNAIAPGYLAKAIAKRGGRMIHISTDYVFDGTHHTPYHEDDPTCPTSIYGRTKLEGERQVMQHNPQSMIIRTAWLYSTEGSNFVKTMLRLSTERETLGVVFDQIGSPTYARDLARMLFVILEKEMKSGIYHFSNEGVTSWYDFAKAIYRIADIRTCRVTPLHTHEYPTVAPRPHYSLLDKSKIKRSYTIQIPHWEESLQACIEKLLETP